MARERASKTPTYREASPYDFKTRYLGTILCFTGFHWLQSDESSWVSALSLFKEQTGPQLRCLRIQMAVRGRGADIPTSFAISGLCRPLICFWKKASSIGIPSLNPMLNNISYKIAILRSANHAKGHQGEVSQEEPDYAAPPVALS